ncbi:MAG: ribose 5-phosphate isomerase B [Sarcina sp.]
MKIAVGCDHGGFLLKTEVLAHLEAKGIECKDFGTYSEESCDYPDISIKVAEAVAANEYDFGILVCGTGIGISLGANKVPGIRAALCGDTFSAKATRNHNNANILALGQRVIGTGLALEIVDTFLAAEFEGGRHQRRLDKLTAIEEKYSK